MCSVNLLVLILLFSIKILSVFADSTQLYQTKNVSVITTSWTQLMVHVSVRNLLHYKMTHVDAENTRLKSVFSVDVKKTSQKKILNVIVRVLLFWLTISAFVLSTALRNSMSVSAMRTSSNKTNHVFVLLLSRTQMENVDVSIISLSMKVSVLNVDFGVQNAMVQDSLVCHTQQDFTWLWLEGHWLWLVW